MLPLHTPAVAPTQWQVRGRALPLAARSLVMGIVNVTPDSFSDGGQCLSPDAAVAHGQRLLAEGADLLDVGGESTRPGAPEVPCQEELRRVLPVVERLAGQGALVSIDTRKAAVGEAALAAGAAIVNDVSGGRFDPGLPAVVGRWGAGLVLMHSRGTPADMRARAVYHDLVGEVAHELLEAAAAAQRAGVSRSAIALDPGLGFAKDPEQNWTLLARLDELAGLGYPLLLGSSRKSFLSLVSDLPAAQRDLPTAATLVVGRLAGAGLFRVHNVALARAVLAVADRVREATGP